MKKAVLSVLGLALLAGCSGYDYYETNVRYRQKGEDCVYYYDEIFVMADRNTRCEDLYNDDTFGFERNDRKAIVPAYIQENPAPKCGCNKCGKKQVLKNRYVIVPAFAG